MAKRTNAELLVITKSYDFILWSCKHVGKFPRDHRFVLGERLERSLYDLLELLIQAKYSKENRDLLDAANLKLEIIRFQMRLAGGVVFKPAVHRRGAGWGRGGLLFLEFVVSKPRIHWHGASGVNIFMES